jgi:2-polyprenyl-3-methyl-5-hydroxy-6-metoxy-1,4-benzoquinol methylase
MNFSQRSYQKELLDCDNIPFEDIERNMQELNFINTYLGGHSITIDGFKKLLGSKKRISICEIGCGGGDNLFAVNKWCAKKNIAVKLTGIDINNDCITVANSKLKNSGSTFIVSDYRLINFKNEKPDIIFSSLFCHHFTNDELINMLQWMQSNSTIGFFINDLHRNFLAYHSIKMLTHIFSKSYLVKNDAPLSVLRGFIENEWEQLLNGAGITNYFIHWKWAFRWLIVYKKSVNG